MRRRKLLTLVAGMMAIIPSMEPTLCETHGTGSSKQNRLVKERAWIVGYEFLSPRDGFNSQFRDIDVQAFSLGHAWRVRYGLEPRFSGLVFLARGTRGEPFSPDPLRNSDATGIGFGPGIRWNIVQTHRLRGFAEADADLIWAKPQFPAGGSATNGFLRSGFGLSVQVKDGNWFETAYRWAHVSNGGGIVESNPAWNGKGLYFGWRHTR